MVLAAGGSTRFGGPKTLAVVDGRSLIRISVEAAIGGGCSPVIAVLGFAADAVRRELADLPVDVAVNSGWTEGLSSSIRVGLDHVERRAAGSAGVLLMACDQSQIDDVTVRALILASGAGARPAACAYAGTVGVPAVVPRDRFRELRGLEGDSGAKQILESCGDRLVRVAWPAGEADIDRPADL